MMTAGSSTSTDSVQQQHGQQQQQGVILVGWVGRVWCWPLGSKQLAVVHLSSDPPGMWRHLHQLLWCGSRVVGVLYALGLDSQ